MPYMIVNNLRVEEVTVVNETRDYYTVFFTESPGAARIRKSRIYDTKEAAQAELDKIIERRDGIVKQPERVSGRKMPNRE